MRFASRFLSGAAGCLILLGVSAGRAAGQNAQSIPQSPQTLKISTEVVNVFAVVSEKGGRLVPNLTKDDFEIDEDGVPQTIKYFSRTSDTPLTLGILIDTSPSQQRVLPTEQEEAKAFVNQVIRPKDIAFILHFDLDVELLQDFTSDHGLLARAIDETQINGGGAGVLPSTFPSDTPCCTHLYDAVYLASNNLLRDQVGRKVIIELTDGEDMGSQEKLNAAIEAAQKSDVIIYSIDVSDRSFYAAQGQFGGFNGDSVLEKLSGETGGRVIKVSRKHNMSQAFQEIEDELRTQYLLGYTPTNSKHDGTFRKIRVEVRGGKYKVQARRGYYASSR